MSILHLKSNTIADATGTLTVFNTAGSTETAAATNLVRPSDWNSAHAIAWNLGGNTAGAAAVSGTDVSLFGRPLQLRAGLARRRPAGVGARQPPAPQASRLVHVSP